MSRIHVSPQFYSQDNEHIVVLNLDGAESSMGFADVYSLKDNDSVLTIHIGPGEASGERAQQIPLSEPVVIHVQKCPKLRMAEVFVTNNIGVSVSHQTFQFSEGVQSRESIEHHLQEGGNQFRFGSCHNLPSPVHHSIRASNHG